MTINRADLLLDLAAGWRPDWDRDELSQALVAARFAEWTPDRCLRAVTDLLCDPKGFPRHLKAAAARPFERQDGDEPSAEWRQRKAALIHDGGTE